MELDQDDLSYLGSGGFVSTGLAGPSNSVSNNHNDVDRNGGYGQSDDQNGGMAGVGGADMDAIVAESVKEMRRRSLANGFGLDYLTMGDDEPYSNLVSPSFSNSHLASAQSQLSGVPTTLDDVMDMNTPVQSDIGMLSYGGAMSAAEMQPTLSIYSASQGSMTPRQTDASPVSTLMSPSMPSTPTVSMGPSPLLSRRTSSMTGPPSSDMNLALGHGPGPPSADALSNDQPMTANTKTGPTPVASIFPENIYSSSGFDMLDILINIGAVDMSCAFVVTDVRKFDNPIVYCSATFERLTGYTKYEVLGRNCRFLQAPDGNIKTGDRRKYVDESAVLYLKNQIAAKAEAQTSLINYRKGGQSFTNLLTMIPIPFDDDEQEIVYFVGFQVDLVDQPGAMMNKNRGMTSSSHSKRFVVTHGADALDPDGSFSVNYQYSQLPTYVPAVIMEQRPKVPVGRDDVSQVLTSFNGNGDSGPHTKRILDKVLLENADDVVHVLSLKGLFLYCSPSIRKVLEYEPHELVGTSLSGVCHPSDIVPVTRDLKDTSMGTSVNVVFRIRRKFSGYTWFESHGCLHTEQGKGRKCIILVGRERPVYMLQWKDVNASGGIGENELWTKMSTSGMFLYVSSNSKALLDRESEDLIGTSAQALMRPDSKNELGKALEISRAGNRTNVRHEIQNKRGQFLQALTTLYPGDGNEYRRPTFLIAQTRLLKHTRSSSTSASPSYKTNASPAHMPNPVETPSSHGSTPSGWSGNTQSTNPSTLDEKSNSTETPGGKIDDNMFEELKTTRSTSWQFELRQMQRTNKRLVEELSSLLASKKKRKRRKGVDQLERDCANCHTRTTPEWRRGPSGKRDLCNSCGLRYAKLQKVGRGSSRTAPSNSDKGGASPLQRSPLTTHSLCEGSASATSNGPVPRSLQPIIESSPSASNPSAASEPSKQQAQHVKQQVAQQQAAQQQQNQQRRQSQSQSQSLSEDQVMTDDGGGADGLDSVPVSPTSTNGPGGPRTMVPVMPMKAVRRGSHGAAPKLPPMTQVRKGSLLSPPAGARPAPQSEIVTHVQFTATPRTSGSIGVSRHGRYGGGDGDGARDGARGHVRTIDGELGVG
ncbi:tuber borchii white collar-1 [Geopyxis carbonaria]|nr:tuber borchii white collar-1 [Geopyxis carbonaria]